MTKILLIDDERELVEEIADILTFEGYETVIAGNGHEGIRLATEHRPDLIICDIMMPELDGYDVLDELQSLPETRSIPFIFLSARADKSHLRLGMRLGADDYLTKPFTTNDLLAAIETRLNRKAQLVGDSVQQAQQARESLIRLLAHEMRNPLTSLKLSTSLIEKHLSELSPAMIQDLLDTQHAGSNRLQHLIEQMVLYVRLEAGTINEQTVEQNRTRIPLQILLLSANDYAHKFTRIPSAAPAQINLEDDRILVYCDVGLLRHALAEIIANALDHSESVTITADWSSQDGLTLYIQDNGPGIAPEHLRDILQHLHRPTQGLGIGLRLANQIVRLHGGQLNIQSATGQGTRAEIHLPY